MVNSWLVGKKLKYTNIYIQIKNENIYIEEELNGEEIANELIRLYVPKSNLILAFKL